MKKRISAILAIVLSLSILVCSFAIFGVSAEDQNEQVTVGTTTYNIVEKSTAHDAIKAMVNGLTAVAADSVAADGSANSGLDFSNATVNTKYGAWEVSAKIGGGTASSAGLMTSSFDYASGQIAFDPTLNWIRHTFDESSIAFGDTVKTLYVNPGNNRGSSGTISFTYTATSDGKIIAYDAAEIWAMEWWESDSIVTVTIEKNGTLISSEASYEVTSAQNQNPMKSPDLGEIIVKKGDKITFKYSANRLWTKVSTSPVVAYTEISTEPIPEFEEITIGENTYKISTVDKSNARDVIAGALVNTAFDVDTDIELSGTAWNIVTEYSDWGKDSKFAFCQHEGLAKLAFEKWIAKQGAWGHEVVIQDDGLVVNPGDNGAIGYISLTYKAPKAGDIVLYDVAGSIKALKDSSPYWAWWDGIGRDLTVEIYKNDTLIWPTANENNKLTETATTLDFPDLGVIELFAEDVITVKFNALKKGYVHTLTDLEVAYIYEEPKAENEIVIGENTYIILPEYKYSAYEDFTKLAEKYNAADKSDVKFTGKWSIDAKYTKAAEYGKDPWGVDFGFKYQVVNAAANIVGFQSSHYMTGNSFAPASVILNDSTQKLMVSPYILWNESICDVATQRVVFTADRPGSVVIYDEFGCFDGNGFATDPYWANEAVYPDRKTTVEIHKNGKKIWPTGKETAEISGTNLTVAFPDLGEIKVKSGDEIAIVYTASKVNDRTGVANAPVVAYTEVTGPAQTGADFSTNVMVLVCVIMALCSVAVTLIFVSKKVARN